MRILGLDNDDGTVTGCGEGGRSEWIVGQEGQPLEHQEAEQGTDGRSGGMRYG